MRKIFSLCVLAFILFGTSYAVENKIPLAILKPVSHPSLDQIEKGFKETIEKECPDKYDFVTFNAQGNKTLMRSEVDEILRKNYPLIFTIGTLSSQMMCEVASKKGSKCPIVFTCVNDPLGFQLVVDEKAPGGNITGVKELLNFQEELEQFIKYKPHIKNMLLVLNPIEPGLMKDQSRIAAILNERKIALTTVEIFQTNELLTKVSTKIGHADAVLILKDNTVVSGLDALVKLCNRHRVPLIASDLDSPDRGAAFGYGVYEKEFGVEAAKKALMILEDNIFPGNIEVTPVPEFIFKINKEAAKKQGIDSLLLDKEGP